MRQWDKSKNCMSKTHRFVCYYGEGHIMEYGHVGKNEKESVYDLKLVEETMKQRKIIIINKALG